MEIYNGIDLENFVRDQFYEKKSDICDDKPTLSDYREELIEEIHSNGEKLRKLQDSKDVFEEYGINFNKENFENKISSLKDNSVLAYERVKEFDRLVANKQENCEHEWHYTGHDSHYDFYRCPLCGLSDKA